MSKETAKKNPLEKVLPFFKEGTEIQQLTDIPELPVKSLEEVSAEAAAFLKEKYDVENVGELAQLEPDPANTTVDPTLLEKWIKICSLLVNYSQYPQQEKKILLVGLDNAGKTSLLAVLQNKYSVVKNLLPTRGLSRETLDFFGYPIVSWDLGGQLAYREKLYFAKPELFFSDSDIIFFVVDIQDAERFQEARDYFGKILEILEELNETPKLMVIFHKLDIDLRKDPEILERKSNLMKEFTKVKRNFDLIFVDTTIYDRSSIERAFSIGFKEIATPSELMRHILMDFAQKVDARSVALVNEAGFVFESWAKDEIDEQAIIQTSLLLQTLTSYHHDIMLAKTLMDERIVLEYERNNLFFICETIRDLDGRPLFLWVLSDQNLSESEELLTAFKKGIVPVMNFFL